MDRKRRAEIDAATAEGASFGEKINALFAHGLNDGEILEHLGPDHLEDLVARIRVLEREAGELKKEKEISAKKAEIFEQDWREAKHEFFSKLSKLRGVLSRDENDDQGTDYTLDPNVISCWITVDVFSIYIHRTDEGVVVDIYPRRREMNEPMASTYAFTSEATGCEECGEEIGDDGDVDLGLCKACVEKEKEKEGLEIFLGTEQPETCRYCGARVEIREEKPQEDLHEAVVECMGCGARYKVHWEKEDEEDEKED